MASTLLAVEDSVTMRKVLEITFAGPDFRVVTAQGADVALQKLKSDKPDLVIADVTLEGKNGYELCKAIKQASPATPVLILSSKQNPFDAARGSAAQADDHMDKPFDTQQMIDKVKKLLAARGEAKPAAVAAAALAPAPAAAPAPALAAAAARPAAQPVAAAPAAAQRAKTLLYNPPPAGSPAALAEAARAAAEPAKPIAPAAAVAKPAAAAPVPKPDVAPTPATGIVLPQRPAAATTMASMPAATPPQPAAPAAAPAAPAPAAPAPAAPAPVVAAAAVTAQVNGQMASKLEEIGLTPAQVEAVLALSRDVIERVAWEVVPVLAETIIKEEIARLTR